MFFNFLGSLQNLSPVRTLTKDEKFRQRFGGFRLSLYLCREEINTYAYGSEQQVHTF